MRRLLAILFASILVASMSATAVAAPGGQSGDHATMFYMSLGDSLAAGYQPTGQPPLYMTKQGYAEQLLALARAEYPKLQLIKLGCPGETTVTMTEGGGQCVYEEGSQLAQALVLLKAHQGRIAFITIDLGWDDFPCQTDVSCLPPGIASISKNLPAILAVLREAAPGVPIVGATIYDPFLVAWLAGPSGQLFAQASVPAIQYVNAVEASIYAEFAIPVADVEGAFATSDWTVTTTPFGPLPQNVANICTWTWVCVTYLANPAHPDFHANAIGYGVIAEAFWAKLH